MLCSEEYPIQFVSTKLIEEPKSLLPTPGSFLQPEFHRIHFENAFSQAQRAWLCAVGNRVGFETREQEAAKFGEKHLPSFKSQLLSL